MAGPRPFPTRRLVSYGTKGKNAAFPVSAGKSTYFYNMQAYNNAGAAANVGLCQRFNYPKWTVWQYVDLTHVATDVGSSVNGGTAKNIFTGTNNDGYIVGSSQPFSMIGFTISTNSAGGTFTYKYWNGTSYTTLTTLEVPANYNTAADTWVVFQPPQDWVAGTDANRPVNSGQYNILIQSTVAPAGAVAINNMWVAQMLEFYEGVANNASVQLSFPADRPYAMDGGDSLIPYFATTNAANQVSAFFAIDG